MHHESNLSLQSVSFPPPPIAGPPTSRTLKYAHHKLPKSQRQQPQPKLEHKRDPAVKHKDSPPQHNHHQSVHLQPPPEPVPTEPEREYTKEEIQAKRQAVASHRLLQLFSNFMKQCRDDGIIPHVQELAEGDAAFLLTADFGLEEFFKSQGVDTNLLDERHHIPQQVNDRKEFVAKLEQLQKYYKEELDKLDRICEEFCLQLSNLVKNHLLFRPVLDREIQLKVLGTRRKFDYVKNQVRQNVCHAIVQLQRRYNQERLVKRTLSKEATLALNEWFFEHLHDPYPTEEEKLLLASRFGLTIVQINNWFGNKRIRYKRRCLQEESKRTSSTMDSDEDDDFMLEEPPASLPTTKRTSPPATTANNNSKRKKS